VAITSLLVWSARTTSSSRITLAGEKKCRPITVLGRFTAVAISSMFERGCVGREDRARLADLVQLAEDLLLHRHVLEHRLDDEVAVGELSSSSRPRSARCASRRPRA
jgi:hypothetical protein